MSTVELPPLPEPGGMRDVFGLLAPSIGKQPSGDFTADQLRAYARIAVDAALEDAAQIAERDEFYGSSAQHAIAAAIRELKGKQ